MSQRAHIAVAVSSVLFVVAVGIGFYAWANPGYEAIAFDRVAWSQADAERRGYMVRDLLADHELIGLTRQEVTELLGPPDEDQVDLHRYRYYLGKMGRNPDMLFFWGYSLLIRFDENDQATQAYVAD